MLYKLEFVLYAIKHMNEEELAIKIAEKRNEITHYQGVLERYQSGRWLNMGIRHMEELENELKELCDEYENLRDSSERVSSKDER